jgi:hypothetical protein
MDQRCQVPPFLQAQRLSAALGVDASGEQYLLRMYWFPMHTAGKGVAQCFSFLAETGFRQAEEGGKQGIWDKGGWE